MIRPLVEDTSRLGKAIPGQSRGAILFIGTTKCHSEYSFLAGCDSLHVGSVNGIEKGRLPHCCRRRSSPLRPPKGQR